MPRVASLFLAGSCGNGATRVQESLMRYRILENSDNHLVQNGEDSTYCSLNFCENLREEVAA